jgi:DNA topoisomerase-3
MTCVSGHLTVTDFGPEVKDWSNTPPERLFDAPVHTRVEQAPTVRTPIPFANQIPAHRQS